MAINMITYLIITFIQFHQDFVRVHYNCVFCFISGIGFVPILYLVRFNVPICIKLVSWCWLYTFQ